MLAKIIFQSPSWLVFLMVFIAIAFAVALYLRAKPFNMEQSMQRKWNFALGAIRFTTVLLLLLLLLAPYIKSTITEKEEPIIVLAVDNSESILFNGKEDSILIQKAITDITAKLEGKFELVTYSLGEEFKQASSFNFKEKSTNLTQGIQQLADVYYNQNVGAAILISDGIYNQGFDPTYAQSNQNFPIYTLAVGDTSKRKDLLVNNVLANKLAYLNDRVEVVSGIKGINCTENFIANLYQHRGGKSKLLASKKLESENNFYFNEIRFELNADAIGLQHYSIQLSHLDDELTHSNNQKSFYIDVLDARQKVLILANAPHADLTALKSAINSNLNYKLTLEILDKTSKPNIDEFDLVMLHQLPSKEKRAQQLIKQIKDKKKACWFIAGSQSDYKLLNQAQNQIKFSVSQGNTNNVKPAINQTFDRFQLNEKLRAALDKWPPLISAFGDFKTDFESNIMLYQKIGSVESDYPLLNIGELSGRRTACLSAEGIWLWRMYDFQQNGNHQQFDGLINQIVQFLSSKSDKRKFRTFAAKDLFTENEKVKLFAELYNDNFELINDPNVNLEVSNSQGETFEYIFGKSAKAYSHDLGYLPADVYSWTAQTTSAGKRQIASGKFAISQLQLESLDAQAKHSLLYRIAKENGGDMFGITQTEKLLQAIQNNTSIKPVLYESNKTKAGINFKCLFFLILTFLGCEWFVRKYKGAY